jgi:hypothetical protein
MVPILAICGISTDLADEGSVVFYLPWVGARMQIRLTTHFYLPNDNKLPYRKSNVLEFRLDATGIVAAIAVLDLSWVATIRSCRS